MKINNKKIIAWAILALVYFFPFKYAFFAGLYPGKQSVLNFIAVIVGCIIFAVLLYNADESEAKH